MSTTPPNKNDSVKSDKDYFWNHGEFYFILLSIAIITIIRMYFIEDFKKILVYFDGFDMMNQLLIPLVFGALGGYCYIIIDSVSSKYRQDIKHIKKKFSFVGSIAGVTAVNLLNPSGSVSQVMILALIAGLSGFSYLKRNALVDSRHEDSIMKGLKAEREHLPNEEIDTESEEYTSTLEELKQNHAGLSDENITTNENKDKE